MLVIDFNWVRMLCVGVVEELGEVPVCEDLVLSALQPQCVVLGHVNSRLWDVYCVQCTTIIVPQ